MRTAAVVLAAGAGTRYGAPDHKLLADFRGRPLVTWAVDAAVEAGLDETIVVVGAVPLTEVLPDGVVVVDNPAWEAGAAGSLRCAVDRAAADGVEAVVVALGDQPLLEPSAWRAVAASDAPIAVATYDGHRGHPVRLDRTVWPLLPTDGDEGGRVVMRRRPELVREIPCRGAPTDMDTVEDFDRWS